MHCASGLLTAWSSAAGVHEHKDGCMAAPTWTQPVASLSTG